MRACAVSCALASAATLGIPGYGTVHQRAVGNGVTEALGLPYAQAPVGDLRFRPPQPLGNESKIVAGSEFGPACMQQADPDVASLPMSEDCLTLNIWAPAAAAGAPVYVYIHGGGFVSGTGRILNGSKLAEKGVVVVTINYRLAALGFLPLGEISEENPEAPSNGGVNGLMDQVEALRWVQKHISHFGGDPAQVTMGGESAGALSVCTHLHMKPAQGLFHRAILESGSCIGPWGASWGEGTVAQMEADAFKLQLKSINLEALRKVPVAEMLNTSTWTLFMPSIDGFYMPKVPAESPMLTSNITILLGSNSEDTLLADPWLGTLPAFLQDKYRKTIPTTSAGFALKVVEYFGLEGLIHYPPPLFGGEAEVKARFLQMSADMCNTCPAKWLTSKAQLMNSQVHQYFFAFWPNRTAGLASYGLACHACEMDYAFNYRLGAMMGGEVGAYLDQEFNDELGETMSQYWASFVASGAPKGKVDWPLAEGSTNTTVPLMVFGQGPLGRPHVRVEEGVAAGRCDFVAKFGQASAKNQQAINNFCSLPVSKLPGHQQVMLI